MLSRKIDLLIIACCLVFISACSIYKSTGRSNFESKAPTNTIQSISIQSCDNVSEFTLDISSRLSSDFHEMIYSADNSEIWKHTNKDGSLNITVVEKLESDYSICHYTFASIEEWTKVQDDFFLD